MTIASACAVLLFSTLAFTQQQIDVAVGGGTLFSTANKGISEALLPSPEKGGTYPSVSVNVIPKNHFFKNRIDLNVETSWRDKRANYYGYEKYRPILTDVNALFQQRVNKKAGLDFLGGIGIARTNFYLPSLACDAPSGTCYTSGTHFMEHLGFGVHYYVWRSFFVRPEAHYYHIQDNQGFNSNSVLRVGASIGYSFDRH